MHTEQGLPPLSLGLWVHGWEGAGKGLAGSMGPGKGAVGQEETGCLGFLGKIALPPEFWLPQLHVGGPQRRSAWGHTTCVHFSPSALVLGGAG